MDEKSQETRNHFAHTKTPLPLGVRTFTAVRGRNLSAIVFSTPEAEARCELNLKYIWKRPKIENKVSRG